VKYVAEKLATIKNTTIDAVAEITSKNALGLFKIPV
jgi:Tat protein secretion system quality control protein TatD with DNase activity